MTSLSGNRSQVIAKWTIICYHTWQQVRLVPGGGWPPLGLRLVTNPVCHQQQYCHQQSCLSPILFLIFMDRTLRHSHGGRLQFGGLMIISLLFVDDVALMASSVCDLQHSLNRFASECEVAGMRISTSESEVMVLSRKPVDCPI